MDCSGLLTRIAQGPHPRPDDPSQHRTPLAPGHTLAVEFAPLPRTRTAFAAACSCGWTADLSLTRWHLRAADLTEHVTSVATPDLASQFAAAAFLASLHATAPFDMGR